MDKVYADLVFTGHKKLSEIKDAAMRRKVEEILKARGWENPEKKQE